MTTIGAPKENPKVKHTWEYDSLDAKEKISKTLGLKTPKDARHGPNSKLKQTPETAKDDKP